MESKSERSSLETKYARIAVEIDAVLENETDRIAKMATVTAMLAAEFDRFSWTGFYLVDPNAREQLVIGPYQGSLGCLRIDFSRGVCGAAAAHGQTMVVADVEAFDGHIACDPRTKSEIVVPVFDKTPRLIAVLDIDSHERAAFSEVDARCLEAILGRVFGV